MHACELLHVHNEKFYRGINYFRGGPNISEIFGPGVQISWGSKYSVTYSLLLVATCYTVAICCHMPYSLLFIAARCTVCYFLPYVVQFAVCCHMLYSCYLLPHTLQLLLFSCHMPYSCACYLLPHAVKC